MSEIPPENPKPNKKSRAVIFKTTTSTVQQSISCSSTFFLSNCDSTKVVVTLKECVTSASINKAHITVLYEELLDEKTECGG